MLASKLASKMAIAFAAQLLCTCTAKEEDLASMSDVCSSSGENRSCDPGTILDAQLVQYRSAEAQDDYVDIGHLCWPLCGSTETFTCNSGFIHEDNIRSTCDSTSDCVGYIAHPSIPGYRKMCTMITPVNSDGTICISHSCTSSWPLFTKGNTDATTSTTTALGAVTNDPHVASLGGDRFDVNQPADYVLLRAPLEYSQPALLELRGTMEPEGSKPCGLYMKAATLSGTWFGEAIVQVRPLKRNNAGSNTEGNSTVWPFSMQVSPEGSWKSLADFTAESSSEALTGMVKITAEKIEEYGELLEGQAFTFHIGKTDRPATITISQAAHQALNVEMANMQALGHQTLGGLLGTEKHSKGVEELTEACKAHRASANEWRASRKSLEVSRMSASWL